MPLFEPHIDAFSAGTTNINSGTLIFSNSNSVSFGLSSNIVTASISVPSQTAYLFSNSNGVSFGTNASTVTATVKTDYQSSGNYLTTAMASNASTQFVQANAGFNGTNASGTIASNSISISVGNYITTAALSNQVVNSINGSTGIFTFNTGSSLSSSRNANSFTFGLASDITTALQPAGAYLTTADLSQNSSKYVQNWKLTGNTAGTTSSAQGTDLWFSGGNSITVSGSSNSIVFSVGAYLTTADLSANSSKYVQNWKLTGNTAGTTSSANGTDLWFSGGNSITISGNGQSLVFSVGNYLTTARASTDGVGLNTALTANGVAWTVNSSGISLNVPAFLTTAMQSNAATISNINVSAGTTSNNLSALVFSNATAGINFGLSGSTITAQEHFRSYYQNIPQLISGNGFILNNASTSYIIPFQLPFNLSASYLRMPITVSIASTTMGTTANTTFTASVLRTIFAVVYSLGVGASSHSLQYVASGSAGISEVYSFQANANGSQYTLSQNITYPNAGANTDNLQTNFQFTNASVQISTGSLTNFTGNMNFDIPFANSLSAGAYWLAWGVSATTSTQANNALTVPRMQMTTVGVSQTNINYKPFGAASNSSIMIQLGNGSFSSSAQGTTASLDLSNISSQASNLLPLFQFIRQA